MHQDYSTVSGIFVGIIAALIFITSLFAWENKGRDLNGGGVEVERKTADGNTTPTSGADAEKVA